MVLKAFRIDAKDGGFGDRTRPQCKKLSGRSVNQKLLSSLQIRATRLISRGFTQFLRSRQRLNKEVVTFAVIAVVIDNKPEMNHVPGIAIFTTHFDDTLYVSGRVTARNRSTAIATKLKMEQKSSTAST
ncbi:hypothetical protein ACROYT_G037623 [Oculina patagonica]